MAENLGGKFATMSEDERRRFAMEREREQERGEEQPAEDERQPAEGGGEELVFDDPRRDHERTKADLEDRDGTGALVDDAQHAARVREEARARGKSGRPPA